MNKYLFSVEKYNSDRSELLIINATIAANKRTSPLAASSLKNHLKFRYHPNLRKRKIMQELAFHLQQLLLVIKPV